MTVLRDPAGGIPKRESDFALFCGYCLERLTKTETGATVCPNGCPP